MMKSLRKSWQGRMLALAVACFFVTGDIASAAPGLSLGTGGEDAASLPHDTSLFSFPDDLGTVRDMFRPSEGSGPVLAELPGENTVQPRWVVHIQDAHANPEAQRRIQEILSWLAERYPLHVAVEGTQGALHPEYFDFFSGQPEAGNAVTASLLEQGELSGAELFAWKRYREGMENENLARIPVTGVESPELYRENLIAYRNILRNRDEIITRFSPLRESLLSRQSRGMNPQLRSFLRERQLRKEGRYRMGALRMQGNLQVYLRTLAGLLRENAGIRLDDAVEQLRFPHLVRFLILAEDVAKLDEEEASRQWQELLGEAGKKMKKGSAREALEALKLLGSSSGFGQDTEPAGKVTSAFSSLQPRRILEGFFREAVSAGLPLDGYSQFFLSLQALVFESEIDVTALFDEIESLEVTLLETLAKSDEEKEWVRQSDSLDLLEKMLLAEMTTGEYEKMLSRQDEMKRLVTPELEAAWENALRFYRAARDRDRVLVENALNFASDVDANPGQEVLSRRAAVHGEGEPEVLALITGGFHTEGLTRELKRRRVPYFVIMPRITNIDNGDRYQRVMGNLNADLTTYFGVFNPFSTKQEAVLFKQAIETAVPVLFDTYEIPVNELARLTEEALSSHPVLGEAMDIEKIQGQEGLRIRTRAWSRLPETAQAVSGVLNGGNPAFNRLVDFNGVNESPSRSAELSWSPRRVLQASIRQTAGHVPAVPARAEPGLPAEPGVKEIPSGTGRSELRAPYNPLDAVRDSTLRNFIEKMLISNYSAHPAVTGGQDIEVFVKTLLNTLAGFEGDQVAAARYINANVFDFVDQEGAFRRGEGEISEKIQLLTDAERAYTDSFLYGDAVLDVGTGYGIFLTRLAAQYPGRFNRLVGTDTYAYGGPDERFEFIRQTTEEVPVDQIGAGTITTAMLSSILHHIHPELDRDQPAAGRQAVVEFLKGVRSTLAERGRVLVYEDSFPANDEGRYQKPPFDFLQPELTEQFLELNSEQQQLYLVFNDWYWNYLYSGLYGMSMPYRYYSMEEWESIFTEAGFEVARSEYWGFLANRIHGASHAFFVLENPASRSELRATPEELREAVTRADRYSVEARVRAVRMDEIIEDLLASYTALRDARQAGDEAAIEQITQQRIPAARAALSAFAAKLNPQPEVPDFVRNPVLPALLPDASNQSQVDQAAAAAQARLTEYEDLVRQIADLSTVFESNRTPREKTDHFRGLSNRLRDVIKEFTPYFADLQRDLNHDRLDVLNGVAEQWHFARIQTQLYQVMTQLEIGHDSRVQAAVQSILSALRSSYLRLEYEYRWRWRRAARRAARQKIWVLGQAGRERKVHDYGTFRIFEDPAALDPANQVVIQMKSWRRQELANGQIGYVALDTDFHLEDLDEGRRQQEHITESQPEYYEYTLARMNAIENLANILEIHKDQIPQVHAEKFEGEFDYILNGGPGGLANPGVRRPEKINAAVEVRQAQEEISRGLWNQPAGRLRKAAGLLDERLKTLDSMQSSVLNRVDYFINRIRLLETGLAVQEMRSLLVSHDYEAGVRLIELVEATYYDANALRPEDFRAIRQNLASLRHLFNRLANGQAMIRALDRPEDLQKRGELERFRDSLVSGDVETLLNQTYQMIPQSLRRSELRSLADREGTQQFTYAVWALDPSSRNDIQVLHIIREALEDVFVKDGLYEDHPVLLGRSRIPLMIRGFVESLIESGTDEELLRDIKKLFVYSDDESQAMPANAYEIDYLKEYLFETGSNLLTLTEAGVEVTPNYRDYLTHLIEEEVERLETFSGKSWDDARLDLLLEFGEVGYSDIVANQVRVAALSDDEKIRILDELSEIDGAAGRDFRSELRSHAGDVIGEEDAARLRELGSNYYPSDIITDPAFRETALYRRLHAGTANSVMTIPAYLELMEVSKDRADIQSLLKSVSIAGLSMDYAVRILAEMTTADGFPVELPAELLQEISQRVSETGQSGIAHELLNYLAGPAEELARIRSEHPEWLNQLQETYVSLRDEFREIEQRIRSRSEMRTPANAGVQENLPGTGRSELRVSQAEEDQLRAYVMGNLKFTREQSRQFAAGMILRYADNAEEVYSVVSETNRFLEAVRRGAPDDVRRLAIDIVNNRSSFFPGLFNLGDLSDYLSRYGGEKISEMLVRLSDRERSLDRAGERYRGQVYLSDRQIEFISDLLGDAFLRSYLNVVPRDAWRGRSELRSPPEGSFESLPQSPLTTDAFAVKEGQYVTNLQAQREDRDGLNALTGVPDVYLDMLLSLTELIGLMARDPEFGWKARDYLIDPANRDGVDQIVEHLSEVALKRKDIASFDPLAAKLTQDGQVALAVVIESLKGTNAHSPVRQKEKLPLVLHLDGARLEAYFSDGAAGFLPVPQADEAAITDLWLIHDAASVLGLVAAHQPAGLPPHAKGGIRYIHPRDQENRFSYGRLYMALYQDPTHRNPTLRGVVIDLFDLVRAQETKNVLGTEFHGAKAEYTYLPGSSDEEAFRKFGAALIDGSILAYNVPGPDIGMSGDKVQLGIEAARRIVFSHLETEIKFLSLLGNDSIPSEQELETLGISVVQLQEARRLYRLPLAALHDPVFRYPEALQVIEAVSDVRFLNDRVMQYLRTFVVRDYIKQAYGIKYQWQEPADITSTYHYVQRFYSSLIELAMADETVRDGNFHESYRINPDSELGNTVRRILGAVITGGLGSQGAIDHVISSITGKGVEVAYQRVKDYLVSIEKLKAGQKVRLGLNGGGDVGGSVALMAARRGDLVVMMQDANGAVYTEKGFSVQQLQEFNNIRPTTKRNVVEFFGKLPGTIVLPREALFSGNPEYPIDVLVTAAVANAINEENVENLVESGLLAVIEGANNSFKRVAARLVASGIVVAWGSTANIGGVVASSHENQAKHRSTIAEITRPVLWNRGRKNYHRADLEGHVERVPLVRTSASGRKSKRGFIQLTDGLVTKTNSAFPDLPLNTIVDIANVGTPEAPVWRAFVNNLPVGDVELAGLERKIRFTVDGEPTYVVTKGGRLEEVNPSLPDLRAGDVAIRFPIRSRKKATYDVVDEKIFAYQTLVLALQEPGNPERGPIQVQRAISRAIVDRKTDYFSNPEHEAVLTERIRALLDSGYLATPEELAHIAAINLAWDELIRVERTENGLIEAIESTDPFTGERIRVTPDFRIEKVRVPGKKRSELRTLSPGDRALVNVVMLGDSPYHRALAKQLVTAGYDGSNIQILKPEDDAVLTLKPEINPIHILLVQEGIASEEIPAPVRERVFERGLTIADMGTESVQPWDYDAWIRYGMELNLAARLQNGDLGNRSELRANTFDFEKPGVLFSKGMVEVDSVFRTGLENPLADWDLYVHWGHYPDNGTFTPDDVWTDDEIVDTELHRQNDGTYRIRTTLEPRRTGLHGVTVYARNKWTGEEIWQGTGEADDAKIEVPSLSDQPRRNAVFEEIKEGVREQLRTALAVEDHEQGYRTFVTTLRRLVRDARVRGIGRYLAEVSRGDRRALSRLWEYHQRIRDELTLLPHGTKREDLLPAYLALETYGIGEVVFAAPEGPHAIAGGLAQVISGLAKALAEHGVSVTVITPLYNEAQGNKHPDAETLIRNGVTISGENMPISTTPISPLTVPLGPTYESGSQVTGLTPEKVKSYGMNLKARIYEGNHRGVRYLFIRHAAMANKLYPKVPSSEELKRAVFLSRAADELISDPYFQINPHIVLGNDWLTGLMPILLGETDDSIKTLHMIHNYGRDYQGRFFVNERGTIDLWPLLGLPGSDFPRVSDPNDPNFLNITSTAIGTVNSAILTVSKPYAEQMLMHEGGENLERFLKKYSQILFGISNGVDLPSVRKTFWTRGESALQSLGQSPLAGEFSEEAFLENLPAYKQAALQAVQRKYGLSENPKATLFSLIGRVAEQKGIELFTQTDPATGSSVLEAILREDPSVQVIIGGPIAEGDPKAEALRALIKDLRDRYPGQIQGVPTDAEGGIFNDFITHADALEIMLASHFFFMPSRYEPGGITQLEALAAGTLIIGRGVGGIAATIEDYNPETGLGNGFLFQGFTGTDLRDAVSRAVKTVKELSAIPAAPGSRDTLMYQAALAENDWSHRISQYLALLQFTAGVLGYDAASLKGKKQPEPVYPGAAGRLAVFERLRPANRSELRDQKPESIQVTVNGVSVRLPDRGFFPDNDNVNFRQLFHLLGQANSSGKLDAGLSRTDFRDSFDIEMRDVTIARTVDTAAGPETTTYRLGASINTFDEARLGPFSSVHNGDVISIGKISREKGQPRRKQVNNYTEGYTPFLMEALDGQIVIRFRDEAARSELRSSDAGDPVELPPLPENLADTASVGTRDNNYFQEHIDPRLAADMDASRYLRLRYLPEYKAFDLIAADNTPVSPDLRRKLDGVEQHPRFRAFIEKFGGYFASDEGSLLNIYLLKSLEGSRHANHPHLLSVTGRDFVLAYSGTHGGREQAVYMTRDAFKDLEVELLVDVLTKQIQLAARRFREWHSGLPRTYNVFSEAMQSTMERVRGNEDVRRELEEMQRYDRRLSQDFFIEPGTSMLIMLQLKQLADNMSDYATARTIASRAEAFNEAVSQQDFDRALKFWGLITYELRELEQLVRDFPESPVGRAARKYLSQSGLSVFRATASGDGGVNQIFGRYIGEEGVSNNEGVEHGLTVGRVRIVENPADVGDAFQAEFEKRAALRETGQPVEHVIWVLPYLPVNYGGIPGEGFIISIADNQHSIDTAKEEAIPLAVIPNAIQLLQGFEGEEAMFRVDKHGAVRFRKPYNGEKTIRRPKPEVLINVPKARTDGPLSYRLGEVDENFVNFVGTKAAALGKLIRAGLPVPDGFALSFAFWQRFWDHNAATQALDAEIQEEWSRIQTVPEGREVRITNPPDELDQILGTIREYIKRSTFPEDLTAEVKMRLEELHGRPVSEAELNQTLIHIKGVLSAKYNLQAVQARIRHKIAEDVVMPAVLVQKPTLARIAGTMFTADTRSFSRNEVHLKAAFGQGASVVGERGQPAEVVINKITGTVRVLSPQSMKHTKYHLTRTDFSYVRSTFNFEDLTELRTAGFYDSYPDRSDAGQPGSPLEIVDVSSDERDTEIFSNGTGPTLVRAGEAIEALFDYRPQDVEWAISAEDGSLSILQTRPQKTEHLPTELMLDNQIDQWIGDFASLEDLMLMRVAHDTGEVAALLDYIKPDVDMMELFRDKKIFAQRVIASRYLLSAVTRRDAASKIKQDQLAEVLIAISNALYEDVGRLAVPYTYLLLQAVGEGARIVESDEAREAVKRLFDMFAVTNTPYYTHLVAFELGKGLSYFGHHETAVQILGRAKQTAQQDVGVADRLVRALSTVPLEHSRGLLEEISRDTRMPDWINAFALRVIDRNAGETGGRSELRTPNPYALEENVSRDFNHLDRMHGGRISQAIESRIRFGHQSRVLAIGVGRGRVPADLIRTYGNGVAVDSIALEDLLYTADELSLATGDQISPEEAEEILTVIHNRFSLANIEENLGDFENERYDIIVVTQAVMEYIRDRARVLERLKSHLVRDGEYFTDLDIFSITDADTKQFFEALSPDYHVYGAVLGEQGKDVGHAIYPVLHVINRHPEDTQIPLEQAGRSTHYRVRSELRAQAAVSVPENPAGNVTATADFRNRLEARARTAQTVALNAESREAITGIAARLHYVFSVPGVAGYLDNDQEAALAWIESQIVRLIVDAERSSVTDQALQNLVDQLLGFGVSPETATAELGNPVHVHLDEAPQDAAGFIPVLAVVAATNGALNLNVEGLDAAQAAALERTFLTAVREAGIRLTDGQFRILPQAGLEGTMSSAPQYRLKEGEVHGFLATEEFVSDIAWRRGLTRFKHSESVKRAEVLAAYIISTIRALALNRQLADSPEIYDPSRLDRASFDFMVKAISTYLEAQQRISSAA